MKIEIFLKFSCNVWWRELKIEQNFSKIHEIFLVSMVVWLFSSQSLEIWSVEILISEQSLTSNTPEHYSANPKNRIHFKSTLIPTRPATFQTLNLRLVCILHYKKLPLISLDVFFHSSIPKCITPNIFADVILFLHLNKL